MLAGLARPMAPGFVREPAHVWVGPKSALEAGRYLVCRISDDLRRAYARTVLAANAAYRGF